MLGRQTMDVVVVDDDADDLMLFEDAVIATRLANPLMFVADGMDLMHFLRAEGKHAGRARDHLPGLILLDLNMPRMDGWAVLRELQADPRLRSIPVIMFTTSSAPADVASAYALGVRAFISKPATFDALVDVVRRLSDWISAAERPTATTG